jgi:hypothetical protein
MARTLEQRGRRLATCGPILLRRPSRRFFRRLVFVGAVAGMLLVAPSAGGVPGDPTPPVITPIFTRGTSGTNTWFISDVRVRWQVDDPESPDFITSGCDTEDVNVEPGGWVACTAESDGGKRTEERLIKLDKTPPAVISTALERQPDANGWYSRPFSLAFVGADAVSGIDICSSVHYAGPDNITASVGGQCRDRAGNTAYGSYSFRYDATPPTVLAVSAAAANRSARIAWRVSADTRAVQVLRTPGRNGQSESVIYTGAAEDFLDTGLSVGRTYEYRVIGVDEAANRAERAVKLVATGALLSPAPAARVSLTAPPKLIWTPVKRASYYNVQLIRGRKVLSVWPVRSDFQLRRTWTYKGRRYKLRPGLYRWYVWPGKGRISAGTYGRRLGSSTFVVTK